MGHTRLRFRELSNREKRIRSKNRSDDPPIRAQISDETALKIRLERKRKRKRKNLNYVKTYQFQHIYLNVRIGILTVFLMFDIVS